VAVRFAYVNVFECNATKDLSARLASKGVAKLIASKDESVRNACV
jgi:hypothetical protein